VKNFLTSLLALLALFPLAGAQEAQPQAALNIAFVRSGAVLAAHPAGQEAAQLTEQARTELQEIATTVQPLATKRNARQQLTPEEQNTLELSERTYQETQERYQQDIEAAAQPAEEEINAIIQEIARENGYTLVLNYEVAQTSGLVVYADDSGVPDITEEVVARIEAANPGAAGEEGGD